VLVTTDVFMTLMRLQLLDGFGRTFSVRHVGCNWELRNRTDAVEAVSGHVQHLLSAWQRWLLSGGRGPYDVRSTPLLAFFAASGIGKTRMLLETLRLCRDVLRKPSFQQYVQIGVANLFPIIQLWGVIQPTSHHVLLCFVSALAWSQ
jgi:hypothetical protein